MNKQTNKDMAAKIFRINYKSDFILTLESDAGWRTPFCIKFWTGAPSLAYFVGWDGETYTHCAYDPSEPSKLTVQFDDHHLPIGDLKYQVAYHFTVADFPNDTEDEVMNQASITTEIDGETYQVMLDFNGETAPEIQFALPAYANETQRIANEEQRIANEQQRIRNEETRIDNEQTRINQESARVNEYAELKADAIAATGAANDAAALANQKAGLADDAATLATQKAGLADDAATLATQKAGLADDAATLATQKAGLADDAATLATQKAGLADDAATLATQKAQYAQDEGDYAKAQGDYAKSQADLIPADVVRTASDAAFVNANREALFYMRQADEHLAGLMTTAEHNKLAALPTAANLETGIIYDVSALHPTSGVSGGSTYASLSAALTVIPQAKRKGGMTVKFVQSSDNHYVQYRYMGTDTTGTPNPFLNTVNWQGVDAEPTEGSHNLLESGGVWNFNNMIFEAIAITTNLTTPGNDGEYLLYSNGSLTSDNNRIYKRVSGSWTRVDNATPAIIPDKPMIWRITSTNRFYYKQGTAVAVPYIPLDQYLYDYFRKSFIVNAIAIAPEAPTNDIGSDGDYYLRQAPSISYHKENGSWVNASNAIYATYGMNVIWKVDNRLYFRQGYAGNYPFIGFDDFAASLATTIRDSQVKFYNLHAANNGIGFSSKEIARQFWGANYGYQKPLGTVLFYTLTDGTVVFEQNIDKRDAPGSANYYGEQYYRGILTGNSPAGISKHQVSLLDGINRTNNPNTVINSCLYTNLSGKTLTLTFSVTRPYIFVIQPTIYSANTGDLEVELYNVSTSSLLFKNHYSLKGSECKFNVVAPISQLGVSLAEIRLTIKSTTASITNLYIKDGTAYYSLLTYTPSLLESFDSNDIEDAVDGMGREILCRVENYKHTYNKNTYRTPVGQGGKYFVTLQKTEASNFKIYAVQDNPANTGNIVVSFPSTEDWSTEKTFSFTLPKLSEGHEWYISFRNDIADITWQKLIVEKAVPKSALSNWANKTIAVYGDSIAAITNINNGNGPTWQVTSNYDWGQRIAHYFHLKSIYGRGIGSQTYKYRGNGGALCWVDTNTGAYQGRLNIYSYDDYLNPETQATVVAAAVEAGYDSQTMTFCRGALSSWDRITKMFPAAIKDSIDAIIVMSVNDDYDDTTNKTWEDFAFVENSEVDPEWAASDYYATYGGDYNNTLQGGIASTVMKLQTWMPQARIILCMSGAGDRWNNNVKLVDMDRNKPAEFTKYDSFIKMHRLLGCPLIDIFGTAGINGLNHETYCADQGIHPYTTAGGRAYAAAVIGGMKGILTLKDVY